MLIVGFDWDKANSEKCEKHGLSKETIEAVFTRRVRVHPDVKHSSLEDRFIAAGLTSDGRPVFVGFTFREAESGMFIRPITARYMHAGEARKYVETFAEDDQ